MKTEYGLQTGLIMDPRGRVAHIFSRPPGSPRLQGTGPFHDLAFGTNYESVGTTHGTFSPSHLNLSGAPYCIQTESVFINSYLLVLTSRGLSVEARLRGEK